jgi:hypothetical protein
MPKKCEKMALFFISAPTSGKITNILTHVLAKHTEIQAVICIKPE